MCCSIQMTRKKRILKFLLGGIFETGQMTGRISASQIRWRRVEARRCQKRNAAFCQRNLPIRSHVMTRTKLFAAKAATISSNGHRPYLHQRHQKHIPEEVVFFLAIFWFSCFCWLLASVWLYYPLLAAWPLLAFWLSWPFGFCWLFLALLAIE